MAHIARPSIDARAAWQGDVSECRKLYRQFVNDFRGSFEALQAYYRWKPDSMRQALRIGSPD